jgi:hypothetical protein
MALRQRKGRTLTGVFMSEDESLGMLQDRVKAGSVVYVDEVLSWDRLHGCYTAKRINHSIVFMDEVCTNQAESFFALPPHGRRPASQSERATLARLRGPCRVA